MTSPIDSRTVRTVAPPAAGAPTEPGSARPDRIDGEPVTGGGGVEVNLTQGPVRTTSGGDMLAEPVPPPAKSVAHALLAARLTRDILATEQPDHTPTPVTREQARNAVAQATPKQSATVGDIEDLGVLAPTDIADLRLARMPANKLANYYNTLLQLGQSPGGMEILANQQRHRAAPADVSDGWDRGWELKLRDAASNLGITGREQDAVIANLANDYRHATDADLQQVLTQLQAADPATQLQPTSLAPAATGTSGVMDEAIAHAAAAGPGWNEEWARLMRFELTAAGVSSEKSVAFIREMSMSELSTQQLTNIIRRVSTPDGQVELKRAMDETPDSTPVDSLKTGLAALGVVGAGTLAFTGTRALSRKLSGQPPFLSSAARATRAASRVPMSPAGGLRWLVGMNPRPGVTQATMGAAQRVVGRVSGPLALVGAAALGATLVASSRHAEGGNGPATAIAIGDIAGSIGGGITGMTLGASIGSRLPGGALLGGLVGGIVGSSTASMAGVAIAQAVRPDPNLDAGHVRSDD